VQIAKLFSIQEYDHEVMEFLAASDVGKFPSKMSDSMERRRGGLKCGEAAMGGYSRSFCSFPFLFFHSA
jgi:hypothetical protein